MPPVEGRAKPIQAMDLPICGRFVDQGGSIGIWPYGLLVGPGEAMEIFEDLPGWIFFGRALNVFE